MKEVYFMIGLVFLFYACSSSDEAKAAMMVFNAERQRGREAEFLMWKLPVEMDAVVDSSLSLSLCASASLR